MTSADLATPVARRGTGAYVLLAGLIVAFYLALPGQTPFLYDEPLLLQKAIEENALHRLAAYSTYASMARPYGPVAVWIDQAFLLASREPVTIMTMHIALYASTLAAGLYVLARAVGVSPLLALPALASPYVWLFSRHLWDNPWIIPFGTMSLGCYAVWLRGEKTGAVAGPRLADATARKPSICLGLCIFLTGLCVLTHLMAVSLAAALLVHAVAIHGRRLRDDWKAALLGLIGVGIAGGKYWPELFFPRPMPGSVTIASVAVPLPGWFHPLLAPRVLSGAWMDFYFFVSSELDPATGLYPRTAAYLHVPGAWSTGWWAASAVTLLAFPLVYAGPLFGLRAPRDPAAAGLGNLRRTLVHLALIALGLECVLHGLTRAFGNPGYFDAAYPFAAMLMLFTLERLAASRPGRAVVVAFGLSLVSTSALLLYRIDQTGGTRGSRFGTTLANQAALTREIGKYAPSSPVTSEIDQSYLAGLCLQNLMREDLPPPTRPATPLRVRYANPDDPFSGKAEVVLSPGQ